MDMNQPNVIEASAAARNAGSLGRDRSIGAILIDAGRLDVESAERIIREQKSKGLRFGDAAIGLGLLTQVDIDFALARQFDYPYLNSSDETLSPQLMAAFNPSSPAVEQLRALRSQLMVRWLATDTSQKAFTIVSPDRGDGRSYIAANLAIVFSQLGERTLLIDADLRNPSQDKLFKLDPRAPGLSAVLSGRANGEAVVRIPSLVGLSVLPAGAVPPNPQELLSRPQFSRLIEQASKSFDAIIIDTAAASTGADAQVTSARAGASLLVARRDHTATEQLYALISSLRGSSAHLLGSVLNAY